MKRYKKKRGTFKKKRRTFKKKLPMMKGIPNRLFAKLNYVESTTDSVAAASTKYYQYHSSLFDPYYGVGGHQCMYFDQYAAMYRFYTVYAIGYDIHIQTLTSTSDNAIIATYSNSDGTVYNTVSSMLERKTSKYAFFGGNYSSRRLKGYISVAGTYGLSKKAIASDDKFSAIVSSDPVNTAKLMVHVYNNSATTITYQYVVRLTYYCKFYSPTLVAQS